MERSEWLRRHLCERPGPDGRVFFTAGRPTTRATTSSVRQNSAQFPGHVRLHCAADATQTRAERPDRSRRRVGIRGRAVRALLRRHRRARRGVLLLISSASSTSKVSTARTPHHRRSALLPARTTPSPLRPAVRPQAGVARGGRFASGAAVRARALHGHAGSSRLCVVVLSPLRKTVSLAAQPRIRSGPHPLSLVSLLMLVISRRALRVRPLGAGEGRHPAAARRRHRRRALRARARERARLPRRPPAVDGGARRRRRARRRPRADAAAHAQPPRRGRYAARRREPAAARGGRAAAAVRRGAPGGSSSSSPLARSAGAKERHAARAEREQRRRDEQQSALDQSLKGFSRPGEVSI